MYEQFYGFREKPFTLNPDPQFLYLAPPHRRAMTMLEYALSRDAPFCLITGEIGSGKTTVLRHLLAHLGDSYTVGLINNPSAEFGPMLPWISNAFGLPHQGLDPVTLYQQFTDLLVADYAAGRKVLLVVDEAQNLNAQRLEELRVLSNINSDKHLVLQTILVGQPELRDTIRSSALRQLAQRIVADYHIEALDLEQTRTYVRHRLRKAGGRVSLFSNTAIRLAFDSSQGIPRLINQFCDRALVYGYADNATTIGGTLMRLVISDRERHNLTPAPD
jgi:type II secretory pathway predicted ATPase ExeA